MESQQGQVLDRIPILAYHLISDRFDLGISRVTVRQFASQMSWLYQNDFRTLTLADYVAGGLRNRIQQGNRKCIVLTFDDAYATLDIAGEIMSRYNFVGTCFPITNYIGKYNCWDYQFGGRKIRHADSRLLRQLLDAGWEIGSHTRRHPCLNTLPIDRAADELAVSREQLRALLGTEIISVSYPFGMANPAIRALARRLGYQVGVALGQCTRVADRLDVMDLPRLGVYLYDSLSSFASKVMAFQTRCAFHFIFQRGISFCARGTVLFDRLRSASSRTLRRAFS